MRFNIEDRQGVMHIEVPGFCNRCSRVFRRGERVRLVYAGPVAEVDERIVVPRGKPQPVGFVSVAQVNWLVEHENFDHCTEPR